MLLVIDIGNTNVTFGLFRGAELGPRWRIRTIHEKMPDEYGILLDQLFRHQGCAPEMVTAIALASVVPPLTPVFMEACQGYLGLAPLVVDTGVRTGVRIRYDNPREVGADRVVDAAAVRVLYGTPACVVDFGTATTFDAVSAEGDYLGGAIAPGIGIAAQALFQRTAKLPRVEFAKPPSVIGRNTPHSIQSGLFYGYVGLVEGMVARFREELGPEMKVIATGGLASLVAAETSVIDVVDPWLTLQGLRLIWELNRGEGVAWLEEVGMNLRGKSIVLGVTGGIAAYKAAALCSHLVKAGAIVDVVLTDAARQFVTPLTFQALTHRPVTTQMFALLAETEIGHVSLAQRADLMIIAPATANTMAKLAAGLADNMLTTTALATRAPILLAPAMESHMWANRLTQSNLESLQQARAVIVVGPHEGRLASGASGVGRMAEPEEILEAACWTLGRGGPLAGKQVLITAGGTREPLDPVRFLGNRSSGAMGYALARAARDRGAQVALISTVNRPSPYGVETVPVETAAEMRAEVMERLPALDVLIMAAAVADFRPAAPAAQKIKKGSAGLSVQLVHAVDVLAEVAQHRRPEQVIVGFAAETENHLANAQEKLRRKRLDLIVANDARQAIGAETNQVTLVAVDQPARALPLLPKEEVAGQILDWVTNRLDA